MRNRFSRRSFINSFLAMLPAFGIESSMSASGLGLIGSFLTNCKGGSISKEDKKTFTDKALGCFMGSAIGDSMGGPVECQHYLRIRKYAGDFYDLLSFGKPVSVFEPPEDGWAQRPDPGTITDDTYIRMDLLKFFLHTEPPYTAEKLANYLLENSTFFGWWEVPLNHLERIKNKEFPAKDAGHFMEIQGGGGGWWQPLSIMHAGNTRNAYEVASELCSIWKTGLARDILSAVVAGQSAAFKNDASIDSVVTAILDFSGDKARTLFERAVNIALESDSPDKLYENLYTYASVANSTHAGEYNSLDGVLPPVEQINYTEGMCSSIAFAEQQPWALAYLVYGKGDPGKTLLTAVKGGRDADSIATNTASWLGALYGLSVWPEKWISAVQQSNLMDFDLMKHGGELAEKALKLGYIHL